MYLIVMSVSIFVVVLIYALFLMMSLKVETSENSVSAYECGFDQMVQSRMWFSYRFFLISILFLVFDVEITLLIPLPFVTSGLGGFLGMGVFMAMLYLGLVYEYYNGVLDWAE